MASWPKRCAKLASKQAMHIHRSLVFLTPHTSLLSLYNQQLAAYTPSPGNGDRVFYETLLEQNPSSEMAQKWCVHHGVLGNQSPSLHFTSLHSTSLHFTSLHFTPLHFLNLVTLINYKQIGIELKNYTLRSASAREKLSVPSRGLLELESAKEMW